MAPKIAIKIRRKRAPFSSWSHRQPPSVVETVPHLRKNFPRIYKVRASKRKTVVQQHPAVGDVGAVNRHAPLLAKLFSGAEIKRGVARQVVRWSIAIRKP